MNQRSPGEVDWARLVSGGDPAGLHPYFSVPDLSRPYHLGTTAPVLGLHRQSSAGLLIPETAREASSPLDYAGVFLTHEELRGTRSRLESIAAMVSRFGRKDMLAALGLILQRLHAGEEWVIEAPRVAASWMVEPAASRCRNLLDQGRQLFTRHGALVLAKLALVHGGDETAEDAPDLEAMLGPLFAAVHDQLGRRPPGDADAETVRVAGELTPLAAYLVANQLFNRSFDEANVLNLYQQRWNNPGRSEAQKVAGRFRTEMGFGIADQAELALAIWAAARSNEHVFHTYEGLMAIGFTRETVDLMLAKLSKPVTEVAATLSTNALDGLDLEWNFDLFEQWPLVDMEDGTYLALEPAYLIRRCLGWAPLYDLGNRGRDAHAMAKTSEVCAYEVLDSMYDAGTLSQRLFNEDELKVLAPHAKGADAAVDFGSSFAVLELTARRVPREVVHGKSPEKLDELLRIVVEELEQVAGTATALQTERELLTGVPVSGPIRFYPIVVMIEGFPTSPVTLSEIRAIVKESDLVAGLPAAPVEVIDLVELEMLEALAESGGPSLPAVLDAKEASNFKYDSVRNYIVSRPDLQVHISERLSAGLFAPFTRLLARLEQSETGRVHISAVDGHQAHRGDQEGEGDDGL